MTIHYTKEQAMDLAQRLAARDLATDLEYVVENWPEFHQTPYLEDAWKILGDHFDLQAVLAPEKKAIVPAEESPAWTGEVREILAHATDEADLRSRLFDLVERYEA